VAAGFHHENSLSNADRLDRTMRIQYLSILAMFLGVLPASAGQALNVGVIQQVQEGTQSGTNDLYLNVNRPIAGYGRDIDQSTTNVANVLQAKTYTIQSISQTMHGSQLAGSLYIDDAARQMASLSQSGENLANVVTANRIENVAQYLGDNASQSVLNTIEQASGVAAVNQYGSNMANVAYADVSIGSGMQVFPTGASQTVKNLIAPKNGGTVGKIAQTAQNMGNVLVADKVENVSRTFNGRQEIDNTFLNAPGAPVPESIKQSGLNVANYISANVVNNVSQISMGAQVITNTAYDPDLGPLSDSTPGVRDFDQSSSNFVNLTVINSTPGSSSEPVSLSQNSSMPQSAQGAGTQSQVANMATINR
jgi:hypothetical protein